MLLTSLLTSIYILTGTFRGLLTFIGLIEYLFFVFTVLVLLRLRHTRPAPRSSRFTAQLATSTTSYRTYTANIFIFTGLSFFLVVRGIVTDPQQGGTIIGILGLLYLIWRCKLSKGSIISRKDTEFTNEET